MYASMYAYTNTNVVYWFWWSSYFIKYIYRFRLRNLDVYYTYMFLYWQSCSSFFAVSTFDPLPKVGFGLGGVSLLSRGGRRVFFIGTVFVGVWEGKCLVTTVPTPGVFCCCLCSGVAAFGWWFVDDDGDVDVGDEIMISFEGDEVVAGADGRDDDEYQLQPAVVAMHVPVKRTHR